MLTVEMIRTWLGLRSTGMADNEHAFAAAAKHDTAVAPAYSHASLIDELIGSAKLVKNGLASQQFADQLRERIARDTDGPEAAAAIWDAA